MWTTNYEIIYRKVISLYLFLLILVPEYLFFCRFSCEADRAGTSLSRRAYINILKLCNGISITNLFLHSVLNNLRLSHHQQSTRLAIYYRCLQSFLSREVRRSMELKQLPWLLRKLCNADRLTHFIGKLYFLSATRKHEKLALIYWSVWQWCQWYFSANDQPWASCV